MFSPGDKVSFINDKLGGVVIRMIDKKQALLRLDDGFEIPAFVNELVLQGVPSRQAAAPAVEDKTILAEVEDRSDKLFFAAVAEDTGKGYMVKNYLVNTRSFMAIYALYYVTGQEYKGLAHGTLEPSRAIKLFEFPLADATLYKNLAIQVIYYSNNAFKPLAPEEYTFKVRPVALLSSQRTIPVLNSKGFLLNLTDREPQLSEEREHLKPNAKPEPIPDIIDLHLEELTDKPHTMLPHEALELQLKVFRNMLEKAVAQDMRHITFIHGVGQGRLKQEIRKILSLDPYVQGFQDADPKKFGYGATLVNLKNR